MPSIRLVAFRNCYERTPLKCRRELSIWLREMVASGLSRTPGILVSSESVETIWVVYEEASNALDLSVEILFSVTDKFNPPKAVLENMVEKLEGWLRQTPLLVEFSGVGVWIRPQPDAIYRVVREP